MLLGALLCCEAASKVDALSNEWRKVPLWALSEKWEDHVAPPALDAKNAIEIIQPMLELFLDAWRELSFVNVLAI